MSHAALDTLYLVAAIVASACAIAGIVVGVVRFIYKRGGRELGFKLALDANTEATKELTGSMKHVVDTLSDHSQKLNLHEWRITKLEATPSVQVNVPSDRNAGSPG